MQHVYQISISTVYSSGRQLGIRSVSRLRRPTHKAIRLPPKSIGAVKLQNAGKRTTSISSSRIPRPDPDDASHLVPDMKLAHLKDLQQTTKTIPRYSQKSKTLRTVSDQQVRSRAQRSDSPNEFVDSFAAGVKTVPSHPFGATNLTSDLVESVNAMLWSDRKPLNATMTSIQALALNHILGAAEDRDQQWLLASETGSGKTLAYILPVLQDLKQSESANPRSSSSLVTPKALVLAPTHELSRQISSVSKKLSHVAKLKVVSLSNANKRLRSQTAKSMKQFDEYKPTSTAEELAPRPVDLLTGTPRSVLEAVRGRGWNWQWRSQNAKKGIRYIDNAEADGEKVLVPKGIVPYSGWVDEPSMDLKYVDWLVVDEADVLLGEKFRSETEAIISDIQEAKAAQSDRHLKIIFTSATVPTLLSQYLASKYPALIRLASSRLHRLPSTLQTEYVPWSGGNKDKDIEKRLRQIWSAEASKQESGSTVFSKALIFCNQPERAQELANFLEAREVRAIALTGTKDDPLRRRNTNQHLDGFVVNDKKATSEASTPQTTPHVLITTSLLSRGLDFSPLVKHVLIVDQPRNLMDFLHRAGRSGRAGRRGKVIVFGRKDGRGSARTRELRKAIAGLA